MPESQVEDTPGSHHMALLGKEQVSMMIAQIVAKTHHIIVNAVPTHAHAFPPLRDLVCLHPRPSLLGGV